MIKRLLLTAVFFIAALPITSNAELIIGANISKSLSADLDLEEGGFTESFDLDTTTASFYIGSKNHRNNRFLIQLDSIKVEVGNYSSTATGVRLDWQFVYTEEKVKPYWGLGFGFYSLKEAPLVPDETQSGISFQAVGGTKIDLNESLELDLQLQFQVIAWQDVEFIKCGSYFCSTDTVEMSSGSLTAGIGLAYKF